MSVQNGDTVRVHYRGTLADASEFDSSAGQEPLEFKVGAGQVIPGFDSAVRGMRPGDEKTVKIPSEDAYGNRREEMVLEVGRDQLPPEINPEVGDQLQVQSGDGRPVPVRVAEVNDASVILDANHPLAGEDLTFAITLAEVV